MPGGSHARRPWNNRASLPGLWGRLRQCSGVGKSRLTVVFSTQNRVNKADVIIITGMSFSTQTTASLFLPTLHIKRLGDHWLYYYFLVFELFSFLAFGGRTHQNTPGQQLLPQGRTYRSLFQRSLPDCVLRCWRGMDTGRAGMLAAAHWRLGRTRALGRPPPGLQRPSHGSVTPAPLAGRETRA